MDETHSLTFTINLAAFPDGTYWINVTNEENGKPAFPHFWEICEDRYQTRSTILTSQLPVARWHEQIGDPTAADGILDRLVHNAHRIEMRGDSMRKRTGYQADALMGLQCVAAGSIVTSAQEVNHEIQNALARRGRSWESNPSACATHHPRCSLHARSALAYCCGQCRAGIARAIADLLIHAPWGARLRPPAGRRRFSHALLRALANTGRIDSAVVVRSRWVSEISVPVRRDPPKIIAHHPILVERASYPQRPRERNYSGKGDHASETDQHDVEIIAWNLRRQTPRSS